MRKIIIGTILIVIVSFASFLGIGIVRKIHFQKIVNEKIARFPSFSFLTLTNEKFNSSLISKGPVLVMHFHPECEHCQWEIDEMFKSPIPKSFSQILLITSAQPESSLKFLNQFHYSDYPSIMPLFDSMSDFEEVFGSSLVPSSYVYDSKLNLLKVFHGEVKTESLLNLIDKDE